MVFWLLAAEKALITTPFYLQYVLPPLHDILLCSTNPPRSSPKVMPDSSLWLRMWSLDHQQQHHLPRALLQGPSLLRVEADPQRLLVFWPILSFFFFHSRSDYRAMAWLKLLNLNLFDLHCWIYLFNSMLYPPFHRMWLPLISTPYLPLTFWYFTFCCLVLRHNPLCGPQTSSNSVSHTTLCKESHRAWLQATIDLFFF